MQMVYGADAMQEEEGEEEGRRRRRGDCQTSLSHYSITHNQRRGTTLKCEHTWL
jgi:hypothetical protein